MNCNLVIANDYGGPLDDIEKLLTKSWLLLQKGAASQFDSSSVEVALSFLKKKRKNMEKKNNRWLNLLSYEENVDLCSWKDKFYNITDNHIKNCKFFLPYTQFKNKGF